MPEVVSSESSCESTPAGSAVRQAVALLRPLHWTKNGLLVLPCFLADDLARPGTIWLLFQAITAFSLTASAGYILNDWCDLGADRANGYRRSRSLAAGHISPVAGLSLALPLVLLAVGLSSRLPGTFTATLGIYLFLTASYSLGLKRLPIVDVMMLAGFYTLRLIAGGQATQTPVSAWLLTFAMFFFASLAIAKRFVELSGSELAADELLTGRGYRADDLAFLLATGPNCGYLSVLVLALYINSLTALQHYHQPQLLWLVCPVVFYWVSRLWLLARRGELHQDPVVFAVTDRVSWLAVALCGALIVGAR